MARAAQKIKAETSENIPPLLPADHKNSRLTLALQEYLKENEIESIWEAYRFSKQAHEGQKRKSGEDYIMHPVSVACIAARFHLDSPSIQAALLHDVVEDTAISLDDIKTKFGSKVAKLVEGLSKLDKIQFDDATEAQAENFRKMLLAMSQDVRVILIKLSDRLHNMQTLDHLKPEKQLRIAQETADIYSPIANRLGLNNLYQELEDLCFRYIHPVRYKTIHKAIMASRGNRKEVIEKILDDIKIKLKTFDIDADVFGREKNPASIHRKMAACRTGT